MYASNREVQKVLPDTSTPRNPRPPSPSTDAGLTAAHGGSALDSNLFPELDILDIFTITPVAALKLLCELVEALAKAASDIPPTPTSSYSTNPIARTSGSQEENAVQSARKGSWYQSSPGSGHEDGVPTKAKTPIGSPEAHPTEPLQVVETNVGPPDIQYGAVARKFYSKKPPPIGLEEYLLRLHKFCPMSTAVYLATSRYIYRMAVIEKVIPITARNVHRLLLAGLRVAMKALEDQSYPHRRFAKVGGVSEPELTRLEVSFCFITNFELRVDKELLLQHVKAMRDGTILYQITS